MKPLLKSLSLLVFSLAFTAQGQIAYETLDINNVKARVYANGNLFWDGNGAHFEVPAGSGQNRLSAANLWLGGVAASAHIAAQRYGNNGVEDYHFGPVSSINDSTQIPHDSTYNRVWKVNRYDIEEFKYHMQNPGADPNYTIPPSILDWPAHGRNYPPYNEDFFLAPFFDINGDGTYNPLDGDYPNIKGDQALFIMFNDYKTHEVTGAEPLKFDIQAMVYAFDCDTIPEWSDAVFINYRIVNAKVWSYFDTYFGFWADVNFSGPGTTNEIQSDVLRSSYFALDGNDQSVTSVTVLAGPHQGMDGLDNAVGINPGESLHGVGFGDGIVDNERMGMNSLMIHDLSPSPTGVPSTGVDYYNYMRSVWRDGTHLYYGGSGYDPNPGPQSLMTNYMYDAGSNPYLLGGLPVWSDQSPTNDYRNVVAGTGPITLVPGDWDEFDLAIVHTAEPNSDLVNNFFKARQTIDKTRAFFADGFGSCASFSVGIPEEEETLEFQVFPNPSDGYLNLSGSALDSGGSLEIYSVSGQLQRTVRLNGPIENLDVSDLAAGLYLLQLTNETGRASVKVLIQ